MVLAAGLGTRLRPLTQELPKPLLPFGDGCLLDHALRAFRDAGLGPDVIVNTHHLPEAFEREAPVLSVPVRLIHEPVLRGTAGGIAGARAAFSDVPVAVATSDVVLERVPPGLLEAAASGGMVLAVAPRPSGQGTVGVGRDGRVVRLRGRHFGEEHEGGEYVGLLALGERALAELPDWGCIIQDYALPLLARGGRIDTFRYEHSFVIAGDDVAGYVAANLRWLERQSRSSFVAPDAAVAASVSLDRVIVGRGAHVEGVGTLARSVVLPGARCRAPVEDAVVTVQSGLISAISQEG